MSIACFPPLETDTWQPRSVRMHTSLVLLLHLLVGSAAGKIWMDTVPALFSSASIVEYWKKGRGGEDDPYDLRIPVQGFNQQLSGIDLAKGITPFRHAQTPRDQARTLS